MHGRLGAPYILHTLGPHVCNRALGPQEKDRRQLSECYRNTLRTAFTIIEASRDSGQPINNCQAINNIEVANTPEARPRFRLVPTDSVAARSDTSGTATPHSQPQRSSPENSPDKNARTVSRREDSHDPFASLGRVLVNDVSKLREQVAKESNSMNISASGENASIAFPSVSTGMFGYDPQKAAFRALETICDVLVEQQRGNQLKTVFLVVESPEQEQIYLDMLTAPAPGGFAEVFERVA